MAIKVIHEPEPKPGTLGTKELYALAVGQVIGAGVITLIVPAIKMTGYSAWLAYFTAILMGFIMVLPTFFVSSTLRLGGGNYSMLCDLAGPKVAGIFAYAYLTQCLSLSLFGTSAAAYLGDIFPILSSHWARVAVGAALLTFFYVVNLMGVDIMEPKTPPFDTVKVPPVISSSLSLPLAARLAKSAISSSISAKLF